MPTINQSIHQSINRIAPFFFFFLFLFCNYIFVGREWEQGAESILACGLLWHQWTDGWMYGCMAWLGMGWAFPLFCLLWLLLSESEGGDYKVGYGYSIVTWSK